MLVEAGAEAGCNEGVGADTDVGGIGYACEEITGGR